MVVFPMRFAVICLVFSVGCTADTFGLGVDDIDVGVGDDSAVDDSSTGDDTKPLFDADDDSTLTADGAVDTGVAADTASGTLDTAVIVDSAVDVPVEVAVDIGVDSGKETGVDSGTDTAVDSGTMLEAATDTGVVSPFLPSAGAVVCTDGMGGTKLCAAGQVCCGTSDGYSCKSSCSALDKDYRCDETADCAGGQICCTKVLGSTPEGSECRDNWIPCFGPRLCQTDAECGAGKTCAPYKPAGAPYTMGRCP